MLDDRSSAVTKSGSTPSKSVAVKFAYFSISSEPTVMLAVKVSPKEFLFADIPNISTSWLWLIGRVVPSSRFNTSPCFAYAGFALLLVNEITV